MFINRFIENEYEYENKNMKMKMNTVWEIKPFTMHIL